MRTTLTRAELLAAPPELRRSLAEWLVPVLLPWTAEDERWLNSVAVIQGIDRVNALRQAREDTIRERIEALAGETPEDSFIYLFENFRVEAEGVFSYDYKCCSTYRRMTIQTDTPPPFMLWPD